MSKVGTLDHSHNPKPSLGLSYSPYLTVLNTETVIVKDKREQVDTNKTVRLLVKTYSWGEVFICGFPKPIIDTTESRSKPPVNEGQRIQDGLSKRGRSRITRVGRYFENVHNRCNMITVGYGNVSLSEDIESKADLDRYLKSLRRYCMKEYGEFHYVWVAEIQELRLLRDGIRVIHYHILTPHFIPKRIINKGWNQSVNKPREAKGLPTQTLYPQIKAAYKASSYIAKYCQKEGHLIKGNGYNMSQETSQAIKPKQQCYDITDEHAYNIQMFESQYLTNEVDLPRGDFDNGFYRWYPEVNDYKMFEFIKYSLEGHQVQLPIPIQIE